MTQLSGSVGRDGLNKKADVRLIQGLLNNYKIPTVTTPLNIDGDVGNQTYNRIETFQKEVLHSNNPDGRVDPNGRTFTALTNRPHSELASSFTVSSNASDLLMSIESLRTKPYDDQTGKDISQWVKGATIGYGHLILQKNWNTYKNGITKTNAIDLFNQDLAPFTAKVQNSVTSKILQNEFDALVILTFNIGQSAFSKSSILKLVNNPGANTSYSDLEAAWMAWNKSQGKESPGLTNRRKAEWAIYKENVYKRW